MKSVTLTAALLAPLCLAAQFRLSVVEAGAERAVGESYSVGTAVAGDRIDTAFRVRNAGSAPALLYAPNVAGQGFTFAALPNVPVEVPAGGSVDFVIRFAPDNAGAYSAYLNINGVRHTILYGTATIGLRLSLRGDTGDSVLAGGQTIDFGSADLGSAVKRQFAISNPAGQSITAGALLVSGEAFRSSVSMQVPVTLKPGEAASFEISFEPKTAGIHTGVLFLDGREFVLRGTGREPVFPRPRIAVEPQLVSGGQRARVSVRFDSASSSSGTGELSMEFRSGVPGKGNDPGVAFVASDTRKVPFTVSKGEQSARFGTSAAIEFQTGSTAGTIVFTARLGGHTEQTALEIPPAPVKIDSVRTFRAASGLDVQVAGLDTSHSASRLSFTFFDREGRTVAPGAIGVDAASAFRRYFETTEFGGIFTVRAIFPVAGNALQITAVEVEMTNALGETRSPRTAIP